VCDMSTIEILPQLPRRLFIQQFAAMIGVSMDELISASGRHPTFFRRWLNGERTSDPMNRVVGEALGLRLELMRRLK